MSIEVLTKAISPKDTVTEIFITANLIEIYGNLLAIFLLPQKFLEIGSQPSRRKPLIRKGKVPN